MAYDGADFEQQPPPPPRRLSAGEERILLLAIGLLLILIFALPVPLVALTDIVRAALARR